MKEFYKPDWLAFCKEMAFLGVDGQFHPTVILAISHRPNVESGFWFRLEWTSSRGFRRMAEAQRIATCFDRAIKIYEQDQEEEKRIENDTR